MTRVFLIGGGPPAARGMLRRILEAEGDIVVVHERQELTDFVPLLAETSPHVVAIHEATIPTSGLRVIEEIMSERPLPILVLSERLHDPQSSAVTKAIRCGALAAQALPMPSDHEAEAALRAAIRLLATIPVVRHPRSRAAPLPVVPVATPLERSAAGAPTPEVVGIGSSAGGPAILSEILTELPRGFGACVLVVQHLPSGFAEPFAAFLRATVKLPIAIATETLSITPGQVILAPDDAHLIVKQRGQCEGRKAPPVSGHRPSVDLLFESLARVYGAAAIGIVLSGIGSDGTLGLRAIRQRGGLTIAQDGQSAAVNGMPRSASESGAAAFILSPMAIAHALRMACARTARGYGHDD